MLLLSWAFFKCEKSTFFPLNSIRCVPVIFHIIFEKYRRGVNDLLRKGGMTAQWRRKCIYWVKTWDAVSTPILVVPVLCIISPHQLPPLMWCIEYAERYPILVITEILEKGEPGFCPQITGFIFFKKLGLELNVDSSYYFVRNETPPSMLFCFCHIDSVKMSKTAFKRKLQDCVKAQFFFHDKSDSEYKLFFEGQFAI